MIQITLKGKSGNAELTVNKGKRYIINKENISNWDEVEVKEVQDKNAKEIKEIFVSFGNLQVRFKGDKKWHYLKPRDLIGTMLKGKSVKKRTRTWFEIER